MHIIKYLSGQIKNKYATFEVIFHLICKRNLYFCKPKKEAQVAEMVDAHG